VSYLKFQIKIIYPFLAKLVLFFQTEIFLIWRCPYGKPVDIWAIGCMVCEMTIGRPLFEGKSDLDQLQKIKSSLGQIAEFQLDELQKSGKQSNVKIMKQSNELFTFERKFSDMNEKLFDFTKVNFRFV